MSIISTDSIIKKHYSVFKNMNKESLLSEAVNNKKEDILEAQRFQLLSGNGNDDNKITPSYSGKAYAKKKQSMNPRPGLGTPDLKLTGSLYEYLKLTINKTQYIITSTVDYFGELVTKYTTAFGLSKSNAQNVTSVQTEYFKLIHEKLNK